MKKSNAKNAIIVPSENQHPKHNCIYMLNGLKLTDKPLYKYMSYERLEKSCKEHRIAFVSPKVWVDPFERRFWKTDFTKYSFKQPDIACMCLTDKSTTNEEAAWRMYGGDTKTVRVSFNSEILFSLLNDYASNNNCKIYVGKAIYMYNTAIIKLHEDSSLFSWESEFSLAHYLTLMCIKRKSFAFENEIRIFIVKDNLPFENDLLKINAELNNTLIPRIILAPLAPYNYTDPRCDFYTQRQRIEKSAYKKKLLELIPKCDIRQSFLYTAKPPLETV